MIDSTQQLGEPTPESGSTTDPRPGSDRDRSEISDRGSELRSLTGLRGASAIAIFIFHFFTFKMVSTDAGIAFSSGHRPRFLDLSGNFAVSIFFVLSGFVLTWSTSPRTSLAGYISKRIGKLYPLYFVTTLAAATAVVLLGLPLSVTNVVTHALLLQSWVPAQEIYLGINPVTWSLSTEFFFYLLFPPALVALRAMSNRGIWVTYGVTVLTAFAAPVYARSLFTTAPGTLGGQQYFDPSRYGGELVYWFTMAFPPYRFLEFLAGMCLAVLFARRAAPRIPVSLAWLGCLLAYVVGTFGPYLWQRVAFGILPLSFLVLALAQLDLARTRTWLSGRVMPFLGKLSYGMYAVQLLIFLPTEPHLASLLTGLGLSEVTVSSATVRVPLMVGYFFVVVAVSYPLYRWIEVPAYEFARTRFRGRRPSNLFARPENP